VFRCKDYPVALLVLHYVLIRKKVYPKFRIADMAQQLNKDERTIRTAVRVLRELELLVLKGRIGSQYYEFNETKYAEYLKINPFESGDAPSQKMGGVPSQKTGGEGVPTNEGRPPSKNGRVESKDKEERESKKTESEKGSQPPSTLAAVAPEKMDGDAMAEAFERLFDGVGIQGPASNSDTVIETKKENGEELPSTSVPPHVSVGVAAASGGMEVGLPSTSVVLHPSDPTPIQDACGNSNAGGQNKTDTVMPTVPSPILQRSASGSRNVGAPNKSPRRSRQPARVTGNEIPFGLTDTQREDLIKKGYSEHYISQLGAALLIEQSRLSKPRRRGDS
jgi:hypothetical protein